MLLPLQTATKAASCGTWRLILIWLQNMLDASFENPLEDTHMLLSTICTFFQDSTFVIKSHLLAALCQKAASINANQKEAKTCGNVSIDKALPPWHDLLQKLLPLLLIALRLKLSHEANFSISGIESQEGHVSIFKLLARDKSLLENRPKRNEDFITLKHPLCSKKAAASTRISNMHDVSALDQEHGASKNNVMD